MKAQDSLKGANLLRLCATYESQTVVRTRDFDKEVVVVGVVVLCLENDAGASKLENGAVIRIQELVKDEPWKAWADCRERSCLLISSHQLSRSS
jgi:hypothetical protein